MTFAGDVISEKYRHIWYERKKTEKKLSLVVGQMEETLVNDGMFCAFRANLVMCHNNNNTKWNVHFFRFVHGGLIIYFG